MDHNQYILIKEFCSSHQVQHSFVDSLNDYGLIQITVIEEEKYLDPKQVRQLEKLTRLHYELEINLEGLDAVNNLLEKIYSLQNEVRTLQNRLKRFEE